MNPTQPMTSECPCGSGQSYADCCHPYHEGHQQAPTAECLMRSRYTAYVFHRVNYLLKSWSQQTRPDKKSLKQSPPMDWVSLEILRTEQGQSGDDTGLVEFIAAYQEDGATQTLHETSQFIREYGHWVYVRGEFSSK